MREKEASLHPPQAYGDAPQIVAIGSRLSAEQEDAGNSLRRLRELRKGASRAKSPTPYKQKIGGSALMGEK